MARFTGRPWWRGGLRQLVLGALAAAATYGIGTLIGVGVS
jgi:VIT1/CCC1 family predicted Fe2+/Mn2+ transporter